MTSKTIQCPQCSASLRVAQSIVNARCPKCECAWNTNRPPVQNAATASGKPSPAEDSAGRRETERPPARRPSKMVGIASLLGVFLLLSVVGAGFGLLMLRETSNTPPASRASEPRGARVGQTEEVEFRIREYEVVALDEARRRRIYDDIRRAARVTREKKILGGAGSVIRNSQEEMLEQTFQRELARFSALHDVTARQIQEILKEGDAKGWDPTPRSNAKRNGIYLYPAEMRK